ncbi:MAG: hypothetical protein RLZZ324_67 [Candidatus Parcubacteria bacterium]|jgi:hypothetical protein
MEYGDTRPWIRRNLTAVLIGSAAVVLVAGGVIFAVVRGRVGDAGVTANGTPGGQTTGTGKGQPVAQPPATNTPAQPPAAIPPPVKPVITEPTVTMDQVITASASEKAAWRYPPTATVTYKWVKTQDGGIQLVIVSASAPQLPQPVQTKKK